MVNIGEKPQQPQRREPTVLPVVASVMLAFLCFLLGLLGGGLGVWFAAGQKGGDVGEGGAQIEVFAPTRAPDGAAVPGSLRNPVPAGETLHTGDYYDMRIVDVNGDAWPAVQAENQFNDPPARGNRMIMIRVHVKRAREETDTIGDSSFYLIGNSNTKYTTYDSESRCGVIPDRLYGKLSPGDETEGNVCFQVPQEEKGLLLVYDPITSEPWYMEIE